MSNRVWQFVLLFFGLLALQVLLFSNIELFGFLSPYVYVLFILLLPVDISPMVAMPLAFMQGLSIDLFASSLGLHATASTILAFIRPYVLRRFVDRESEKSSILPTMRNLGTVRTLQYVLIGVSIHHLALYLLSAATFNGGWIVWFHASGNILFTSMLLLVALALVSTPSASHKRQQRL